MGASTTSELSVRLATLDELVSELTCERPNSEMIRQHMKLLDIEYCEDPKERMSRVLFLIQEIQFEFSTDLPKTSRTKKVRKDGIEI